MITTVSKNIDEFIESFPKETQKLLEQVRATIQKAVPKAEEIISYGIPTFKLYGNLVHFAAYKNHIGFYPGSGAIIAFKKELTGFKTSKGTIQFPLDKPMPLKLIAQIVKFRVMVNTEKFKTKKK